MEKNIDPQLKKGLIEYCIFAILNQSDSYGYQIIKDSPPEIKISESTLYPILRRLEIREELETYSVEHNGRLRKYYKITEAGKNKLLSFNTSWGEMEKIYKFIKKGMKNE